MTQQTDKTHSVFGVACKHQRTSAFSGNTVEMTLSISVYSLCVCVQVQFAIRMHPQVFVGSAALVVVVH